MKIDREDIIKIEDKTDKVKENIEIETNLKIQENKAITKKEIEEGVIQRRRDRSDSSSDYKYRRRNSPNRKRKDSPSSSRSNDKRKDRIERKHNRSRSI
jgi:hypothetical protein